MRTVFSGLLLFALSSSCFADKIAEQKIAQWGDPFGIETKTDCVTTDEANIFGKRVVWCTGWASYKRILQNELYFVVNVPTTKEDIKKVAESCIKVAAGAAYVAWMGTPTPDPASRTAAAVAAGKAAWWGCVGGAAIELTTETRSHWPNWERI